jgi:L-threonylcarbamoyladenylate synthase
VSLTTRVLPVDCKDPDPEALGEAAEILLRGGLVAFATETVYGLGADATNAEAVARIFEAKGRPAINPLIVHAHSVGMIRQCVADWPAHAQRLAEEYWPGPLTLILPRSELIPDIVTARRDTVGVRIPDHPVAQALIKRVGRPIAAPSANRSMGLSPTQARHVLKDLAGTLELILDSGVTAIGLESTVVDLASERPKVLRPGAIAAEQVSATLGVEVTVGLGGEAASKPAFSSPGQMAIHYAPRTSALRLEPEQLESFDWPERAALLVVGPSDRTRGSVPEKVIRIDLPAPGEAALKLYAALHELDEQGLDLIVIVPPSDLPEWRAIRDRIWRAAPPWPPPP